MRGGDCFAEFTLGLAEGETRGLAMTRAAGRYAESESPPSKSPAMSVSSSLLSSFAVSFSF